MKKLDWIFEEEEFNDPPIKIGDIIIFSGYQKMYNELSRKDRKVINIKLSKSANFKNRWFFKIRYHNLWFIYQEKCIITEKRLKNSSIKYEI